MRLIIDRFEGEYAVVETDDKKFFNMPKPLIPNGADEGDILTIAVDTNATIHRENKIKSLMNDSFNKD